MCGDVWWCVVMCGSVAGDGDGVWWCVVDIGSMWWYVAECGVCGAIEAPLPSKTQLPTSRLNLY